ncbi:DUF2637 domain-containing protein [Streptomyces sp. NPDC002867]
MEGVRVQTTRVHLTRARRALIAVVVIGAVIVAAIGFAGSYAAVRELAERKGFGSFSLVFPIGIDAGICVLLALDLLLTWMRIPFPLLRQTAWLLTFATIAFNGAAAWPDPLGVGMHAVIPILFVVAVEAARHAVGRIADITADKHMEGVRLTRWLLSPVPTFRLWRRMKLWELRNYEQVIKLEQDRLIYQARLQARFGRAWRRRAPVESLMPLRLAKYGVPLAETAPAGLAAAGIEPVLLPPAPAQPELARTAELPAPRDATPVFDGRGAQRGAADERTAEPELREIEPDDPTTNDEREDQAHAAADAEHAAPGGLEARGMDHERGRREERADDVEANGKGEASRADRHTQAMAAMKNADAVRFAIEVLDCVETPVLREWLKRHGKDVNSGQIYKIAKAEAQERARMQEGQAELVATAAAS